MNWTQTREKLIAAGLDQALLPDEWKYSINLRGADLHDAYLRDATLRGADLSGADLSGAYLSDADLRAAYLSDANLRAAYLRAADLSDADLRDAYLRDATLSDADLSGADLRGADLSGADLRDANLRDANLRDADLRDATLNWNSHDMLAEIARRAAGDDYNRRMAAGLILISHDWCWDKFIAVLDSDTQAWLGSVFAPYVKDGDGAPAIVRQYIKVEAQP